MGANGCTNALGSASRKSASPTTGWWSSLGPVGLTLSFENLITIHLPYVCPSPPWRRRRRRPLVPDVGPSAAGVMARHTEMFYEITVAQPEWMNAAAGSSCPGHVSAARLGLWKIGAPGDSSQLHRHEFLLDGRHRAAGGPSSRAASSSLSQGKSCVSSGLELTRSIPPSGRTDSSAGKGL